MQTNPALGVFVAAHGDTAPRAGAEQRKPRTRTEANYPGQRTDACRGCGRTVYFCTDGDGHLIARDWRTWRRHPCEGP